MPEHSIDAVDAAIDGADRPHRPRRRSRRTDWRLGGRSVARWNERLLAIALISLSAGVVAQYALQGPGGGLDTVATAMIWLGMLVAVVAGFIRSRPAGLLRFRPVDLLWAVGVGVIVRLVQGWLAVGADGVAAFPALPSVDGHLAGGWWFDGVVAPLLITPALDELFFRAVVLISLYALLRRPFGATRAGAVALLVSTALFVAVQALADASGALATLAALGVLGGTCGLLVLLTGRIWGAIGVHLVYNAAGVGLALLGAM